MFRRIFKVSVPIVLIGIILLIIYNTYQKTQDLTTSPISIIPTNASVILQLNNVRDISKSLQLSNIWNRLQNIKQIEVIAKEADQISRFFITNQNVFVSNNLFLSFHKVSAKKSALLFSTNFTREHLKEDKEIIALFANDITTSKYDNQTIYFSDSLNRYFSFKDNILFYSENKMLLTDAIRTSDKDTYDLFAIPLFSNCYNTTRKSAEINLMINYNNLFAVSNIFTNVKQKLTHFSDWTAMDLELKDNTILASGLSTLTGATNNFTDIFNNQKSQNLNILDIIPENTTYLFAISFNDQQRIYEEKNKLLQNKKKYFNWNKRRKWIEKSKNVSYNDFINEIDNEAGAFNTSSSLNPENTYTYFNTKESIRASSLLQGMIISTSNYRDFRINQVMDNNIVANLFGDLFKANNPFFTTINDYFIFGNSTASIEYIIDHYISNTNLSNSKSFGNINSYISNDANIFLYLNPGKTAETLKNSLIDSKLFVYNPDSISKFTTFSLQLNTTKNGMLHNLCLFYDNKYKESIKEEWYYPLDTSSMINPQFFYNHFTNEETILIQDNYNNLIALSPSGEQLWSKKIGGQIFGKINFIDAYKNNKFQALFNTHNKLYLIDRNGEFVDGFPKDLPTTTSMGHSLIDYDKNKNYRIIIIGDDNMLYNLNKKGEDIAGWKYTKTTNRINQNPIHFVVGNKDYILHATNNGTTKLLARNGTERTIFKNTPSFTTPVNISENGTLYAITSKKKLWTAYVNGIAEVSQLPKLQDNSKIIAYHDGYYISNKNSISYINNIKHEETNIKLDSQVETLSLAEGYIAVTTSNSLYLIKNHEITEGFPINSQGYFNISDIDNDGKINVINIKNGCVYNYELADQLTK